MVFETRTSTAEAAVADSRKNVPKARLRSLLFLGGLGSLSVPALAEWSTEAGPAVTEAASKGANDQDERGADDVSQHILDARRDGTPPAALAELLAGCDAPVLPRLFEPLSEGHFKLRVGERGNTTRDLTEHERGALVAAFGRLPWSDVQAFLAEVMVDGPDRGQRRAALQLFGAHGTRKDLSTLLQWTAPEGGSKLVPRDLRSSFAAALGGMIDRDSRVLGAMPDFYWVAPDALLPSILSVLGERPSAESLWAIVAVLGRVPAADALVLAEVGHVGGLVRHPIDDQVRARVREYLTTGERVVLIESIVACGRLEDVDAVPDLIELLRDADTNVQGRAHDALKLITGEHHGPDPKIWSRWHAEVTEWWSTEAPNQLREVRDGVPAQASRAILELSRRRFYRHQLAIELTHGLERDGVDLVVMCCAALGSLGSPLAVPYLLDSLQHRNLEVRQAAYLALCRITGEDHGEHSQDWVKAGW